MSKENIKISKPEVKTYWILWDSELQENIEAQGFVNTDQIFEILYTDNLITYIDEDEWLEVLFKNNINPYY
jgi:hypothetical protein